MYVVVNKLMKEKYKLDIISTLNSHSFKNMTTLPDAWPFKNA
jgi:hypothetical protein